MKVWKRKLYESGVEKGDYLTKNVIPGSAAERILQRVPEIDPNFDFDYSKQIVK